MPNDNENLLQNLMSMLGDNPSEKISSILDSLSANKENPKEEPSVPVSGGADLLGGMDLGSLMKIQNMVSSLGGESDDRSNLLAAIKPFLNDQRKPQVDQAVKLLKLTKLAQTANDLNLFKDFKL